MTLPVISPNKKWWLPFSGSCVFTIDSPVPDTLRAAAKKAMFRNEQTVSVALDFARFRTPAIGATRSRDGHRCQPWPRRCIDVTLRTLSMQRCLVR
jgi:hypothetical protein